ncbi:MAG TPA: S9 family peptidase [Acidimicrobiales bacterium]|nr:S9 family peptidase [Acidimicrobiales bacterium]
MTAERPAPPVAPRRPAKLVAHGDERVDEWYWLRDKDDPEVISHLGAENDHTREALAHTAAAQELIFEEMRGRILETDMSVPATKGRWSYYSRTVERLQYPISCRRRVADGPDGEEQVLLDQNELAEGHDYFAVVNHSVSPDASLLAYATDCDGSERYTLHVRDLATGHDLADEVPGTYYGLAWAADNRTVFYTKVDEATRPHQLWRHVVGTPAADDVLVFQEDDDHFFLGVHETLSERYILLGLESKVTSEVHYLSTDDPNGKFQVVQPREQGVEYEVDHHAGAGGERFFIVTNAGGAENFKLVEAPVATPGSDHWTEVVPHRPDVRLDGIEVFVGHMVLYEKTGGLRRIAIRRVSDGDTYVIDQPEPVYTVYPETNLEFDTRTFRYGYSSLVTPRSVYDYDLEGRSSRLLKRQPVLGGYEPEEYETQRLWAIAPDGVKVPMSVVHRRGLVLDGSAPTLLYGYGSYESSVDPSFSAFRLSLLERGFVFAIAHVRGGGEMGRHWYDDGKILHKKNTFSDFIACSQHLVAEGYTAPERLAIRGGSAGGLLMGAVTNIAPELFKAVVAVVPFVDVLTTILDESLPLTVMEWEEWGNPKADPEIYRYIKSYSPYDNVEALPYPAMLVLGGLNDPRVSYWEPAKWVQRLRERSTSANTVLLKTEMGGGHMGPSGRYDAWREEALITTFVLDALGLPLPGSSS